jgi:SepF-like predicted cell division protein (DUF552 family)
MDLDIFKKIKGRGEEEEEYIELTLDGEQKKTGKVTIVIESLNSYADSDRIQRRIRDGDIVLIKIKDLKDKDIEELKRSIARIRKTCEAINGDIAGISEEWVVATPSSAVIDRQKLDGMAESDEQ